MEFGLIDNRQLRFGEIHLLVVAARYNLLQCGEVFLAVFANVLGVLLSQQTILNIIYPLLFDIALIRNKVDIFELLLKLFLQIY